MEHLSDTQLLDIAGGAAPTEVQQAHLATCSTCRQYIERLRGLMRALELERRSTPSPTTLAHYYELAGEIQRRPGRLARAMDLVVATLAWDGRTALAAAGQRGAGTTPYRLLYTAPQAEIELMVDTAGEQRSIEGDLIPLEATPLAPALIQLELAADGTPVAEVESSHYGRFRLDELSVARYRLHVSGADGSEIEIPLLELS